MSLVLNGSGTITGATTLASTVTSPTLTTPVITSTLGVGGATPSASGAGITFPATQSASTDANTLDDYEEGTWTPNVYHSGSNNSTWTTKSGRYVKIGSQVTCWFVCDGGNSGTAGTFMYVSGIPFSMASVPNTMTLGNWGSNGVTPSVIGNFLNTSGQVTVYYGGGNITTQASYFSGFFCYQTD